MAKKKNKDLDTLTARHLARFIRETGFFEELHQGRVPRSKKGDFSDVKVVTPEGEIPWNELSRLSDPDMRKLMLAFQSQLLRGIKAFDQWRKEFDKNKPIDGFEEFEAFMEMLYNRNAVSWDRSTKEWEEWNKTVENVKIEGKGN